jgi:hypothetical protein
VRIYAAAVDDLAAALGAALDQRGARDATHRL